MQTCSPCLQSPSGGRYRGSYCRPPSLPLVLSSDTAPTTALNCPPSACCCLRLRHLLPKILRPASELVPPWLEVEIDQLLFQREEEQQQRHVLCGWGGNGTLPFHFGQSYSLFIQARVLFSLHPSKDTSTCTRMR